MQYSKFVKPAFDDFILPTKKYADIIIPRGGDNHVAIDLIVQHIRTKLGQHDLCKIYPNLYVIHSTFQVTLSCYYWLRWSNSFLLFSYYAFTHLELQALINLLDTYWFSDTGYAYPDTWFSDNKAWFCVLCWPVDSFGMFTGFTCCSLYLIVALIFLIDCYWSQFLYLIRWLSMVWDICHLQKNK